VGEGDRPKFERIVKAFTEYHKQLKKMMLHFDDDSQGLEDSSDSEDELDGGTSQAAFTLSQLSPLTTMCCVRSSSVGQ
jgi:hypothetical protein